MDGSEDLEERKGYYAFVARDPRAEKRTTAYVSMKKADGFMKYRSEGQFLEMMHLVPEAIRSPYAVFAGLERDHGPSDGFAYVFHPTFSYSKSGTKCPPRPERVYVVFLEPDMVVSRWEWTPADPEDGRLPVDSGLRFGERLL